MRKVYIAHPFGGKPENRQSAALWYAHACKLGLMAVAPWIILTLVWDESRKDEGLEIDFAQIAECDELWICGDHISMGMELEIAHANKCQITVRDMREFCGRPPPMDEEEWKSPVEGVPLGIPNPDAGKYMPEHPVAVTDERKAPGA